MSATDEPTSQDGNAPMDPPIGEARPVVVVTTAERLPTTPGAVKSPNSHVSVIGYPGDKPCGENNGVRQIAEVVKILEDAGVSCCMVAEPPLIYYGTSRTMIDWMVCVPTEQLDKAADLIRAEKERFEPFMSSTMKRNRDMSHLYPRFKFNGIRLFFTLLTSKACHIVCESQDIEHSDNGIPYPQLHVFAQSLLDTGNFMDLEDLIDGMNLTPEWGEQNLHLDGTIDEDWLLWRESCLRGREPTEEERFKKIPKRRGTWMESASVEAKKSRQGIKYREGMVTRWRREGDEDPRIRTRKSR